MPRPARRPLLPLPLAATALACGGAPAPIAPPTAPPATGAPRPLAVRVEGWEPKPYAASVLADFEPERASCRNCMRAEVTWP